MDRWLDVGKMDRALDVGKMDRALDVGKMDRALDVGKMDRELDVGCRWNTPRTSISRPQHGLTAFACLILCGFLGFATRKKLGCMTLMRAEGFSGARYMQTVF
jgi:hypothetical protein